MAGSLIYMAIYGYRVTSDDDPYVKAAEEFMTISSYAITGSWLVSRHCCIQILECRQIPEFVSL